MTQANWVFATSPAEATAELQRELRLYVRDERTGEVRWMCALDTAEARECVRLCRRIELGSVPGMDSRLGPRTATATRREPPGSRTSA